MGSCPSGSIVLLHFPSVVGVGGQFSHTSHSNRPRASGMALGLVRAPSVLSKSTVGLGPAAHCCMRGGWILLTRNTKTPHG